MTTPTTTPDGAFTVFHYSQAGFPAAFAAEVETGGPWFFQPSDPHGGDGVYSAGYPTFEEAMDAAIAWSEQQAFEEEAASE